MTNPRNSIPKGAASIQDVAYSWNPGNNIGAISIFDGNQWHRINLNSTEEFIALLQVLKSREVWFANGELFGSL